MDSLEKYFISPDASVKEAIEKISLTGKKAVFVVDDKKSY